MLGGHVVRMNTSEKAEVYIYKENHVQKRGYGTWQIVGVRTNQLTFHLHDQKTKSDRRVNRKSLRQGD